MFFFATPALQPIKKSMSRYDVGLQTVKTFPAGVKETTSFLYPDFSKAKVRVNQSHSLGGYAMANKNNSPIL